MIGFKLSAPSRGNNKSCELRISNRLWLYNFSEHAASESVIDTYLALTDREKSFLSFYFNVYQSFMLYAITYCLPILFLTCTCFQIWYEYINALSGLTSYKHSSLELSKPRPDRSHYIGTKYNRYIYPGQLECKLNEYKASQSLFFLWDIESAAIQKHWNCLLNHGENIYHKRELSFLNLIFFKLKI